jgi:hypothetical protein
MTERAFFRWALLLPVAVTLVAFSAVGIAAGLNFYPRSGALFAVLDFAQVLVLAAMWGTAPYAVVAIGIFFWLRKPRTDYSRVLVLAPVAVVVVAEVMMALVALATWNVGWLVSSIFYAGADIRTWH